MAWPTRAKSRESSLATAMIISLVVFCHGWTVSSCGSFVVGQRVVWWYLDVEIRDLYIHCRGSFQLQSTCAVQYWYPRFLVLTDAWILSSKGTCPGRKKTEKQRLKDEQYAWNTETKFMSQCQQRGLFHVVGRLCAIFGHVKPRPACRMAPPRLPKRTRPPSCSTPTAETSIPGLHCFVHKANPDVRHMWAA
jgi:hypothetical protein